jgi:eukaryotic-like serine/threonine-protein kinase
LSSSSPPAASPSEGAGAYEFVIEIARGALGSLFGARERADQEAGRVVAIRRIPTTGCARDDVQAIAEAARIARRVRHSKAAPLLQAVVAEREVLLVGEYVDGCSLSSLLRLAIAGRAPVPPAVVLRIGLELLRGLRAVRETWKAVAPAGARVAPRGGISPDSVFLTTSGDVVLTEVGVSAVASALVPFRTFPGIMAYLAPEQLRGSGAPSIDERAEVFTVGVILWELLANRPLFGDAERLHADPDDQSLALADRIVRDVESKPIPALSSLEGSGSSTVRAAVEVIERALSRDPAARFGTIDQMRVALLALNREALASTERVKAALQALAGSEMAAQRAALGLPGGQSRPPPGSARDSKRPSLAPEAAAGKEPARSIPRLPRPASRSIPPPPTRSIPPPAPTQSIPPPSIPPPPSSISPSVSATPPPAPVLSATPSTPPPAPVRSGRTTPPPPPVRKAKAPSVPPASNVESAPPGEASVPAVAATAAGAFSDPVMPAPTATDRGASRQPRARRTALVIGAIAGLITLVALLRVVLRPAVPDASKSAPAEAATQEARPATVAERPAAATHTPPAPPVSVLAGSSAAPPQRENPAAAPTKPLQHAGNTPGPTAPPETYRRPEVRIEPGNKEYRPNGI